MDAPDRIHDVLEALEVDLDVVVDLQRREVVLERLDHQRRAVGAAQTVRRIERIATVAGYLHDEVARKRHQPAGAGRGIDVQHHHHVGPLARRLRPNRRAPGGRRAGACRNRSTGSSRARPGAHGRDSGRAPCGCLGNSSARTPPRRARRRLRRGPRQGTRSRDDEGTRAATTRRPRDAGAYRRHSFALRRLHGSFTRLSPIAASETAFARPHGHMAPSASPSLASLVRTVTWLPPLRHPWLRSSARSHGSLRFAILGFARPHGHMAPSASPPSCVRTVTSSSPHGPQPQEVPKNRDDGAGSVRAWMAAGYDCARRRAVARRRRCHRCRHCERSGRLRCARRDGAGGFWVGYTPLYDLGRTIERVVTSHADRRPLRLPDLAFARFDHVRDEHASRRPLKPPSRSVPGGRASPVSSTQPASMRSTHCYGMASAIR